MDIYEYLIKDHRAVSALFEEIMHEEDPKKRDQIFGKLKDELLLHAHSEQETFYKALENKDGAKRDVKHAFKEHEEIEAAVHEVTSLSPWDATWLPQVKELQKIVDHHVKEEEGKIFDDAKKVFSEEKAQELEEEMKKYKTLLKRREIPA